MEGNDRNPIYRTDQTQLEEGRLLFRHSIYFQLLLIGIVLIIYVAAFFALYARNDQSYSVQLQNIMLVQSSYQDQYQLLAENTRNLNDYLDSRSGQDLAVYRESVKSMISFAAFLQRAESGPYAYGMGNMVLRMVESGDRAADALSQGDEEGMYAAFDQMQDIYTLITMYSQYVVVELQEQSAQALSQVHQTMELRLRLLIVIFVCFTVLIIAVVTIRIIRLIRPIRDLVKLVQHSQLENWEIQPVPSAGKNETGILVAAFYRMFNRIRAQYDELMKKQRIEMQLLEEREQTALARAETMQMRLQVYQSQINAHFLFNALNIVGRLASLEQAPKTREASMLIASFLRAVLNQFNRNVTLEEEFHCVEQYTKIQELRFGDRIHVDYEMDPDMELLEIPSMTLQPLVENAYIHGVGMKENGYIRCVCETEGSDGLLYVWDDGGTMDRDNPSEIFHDDTTHSIGLKNVYQRLQLKFGERVEAFAEGSGGEWTKIGFRFFDILDEQGNLKHKKA